jgi:chemotaxis methyl-accepting protein methylase
MAYTFTLPQSTAFTGTGLEGYRFGPLRQKDIDVYYIESEKGHDTFMISKKVTRTYYVLSGGGYFTIGGERYQACPGMLIEVPPKIEYSYSGRMKLIAFSRPLGDKRNDTHTRWNPDVTCRREPVSLPGRESWSTRLVRLRIAGKSPVGAFLRLNKRLWASLPQITSLDPISAYGRFVHALARKKDVRAQAFSTHFLRNRPELELIRRLVATKHSGQRLRVAVLGCSTGAEVYSIVWTIRTARPDLELIVNAVDISRQAVEFARRGVYSLTTAQQETAAIFERTTKSEKETLFQIDGQTATVRAWLREGIHWSVGDVGEPATIEELGPQDVVVANNFLCHMVPHEAERCLRNIARLVVSGGYLFASGIDLDVRTKVATDLGWEPVQELLEEIHDGDPCLRAHWPWHYGGLEPLDKRRVDWRIRYAAAFRLVPEAATSLHRENGLVVIGQ